MTSLCISGRELSLFSLENLVLKDTDIVQYRLGLEGALQLTEPCYYLNSVSSPTHTSAMHYSIQTTHQQHDVQSYCSGLTQTCNIWQ